MDTPPSRPWAFADFVEPATRDAILHALSPVVFTDVLTGRPTAAGFAFAIGSSEVDAIYVSAYHVLEHAVRNSHYANLHRANILSSELTQAAVQRSIDHSRLMLQVCNGAHMEPATIVSGWYAADVDLAMMVLKRKTPVVAPYPPILAIDSDQHPVGTKVIAFSCDSTELVELGPVDNGTAYTFTASLHARSGEITNVSECGRLTKCRVYETSIPFTPGMSGGPVLLAPTSASSPVSAIGVVSSDFSESHHDTAISGKSTVIPILMAYGAAFPSNTGAREFLDLRNKGWVRDIGLSAQSIQINRSVDDPNTVTLRFEDTR